jgi:hypothetical protein
MLSWLGGDEVDPAVALAGYVASAGENNPPASRDVTTGECPALSRAGVGVPDGACRKQQRCVSSQGTLLATSSALKGGTECSLGQQA